MIWGGSRRFYTDLFGWSIEEMPTPEGVCHFLKLGGRPVGGMLRMPAAVKGAPTMWMPDITVADLKAAMAKATALGAKLCKDVTAAPGMGRLAIINDPQGATLGLWEFEKQG